ncbi:MAG: hypothetical protein JNL74_05015 [Fibrobacteres bacterium]|nr:hypothetical protein [Fibrobacterota bacterium]
MAQSIFSLIIIASLTLIVPALTAEIPIDTLNATYLDSLEYAHKSIEIREENNLFGTYISEYCKNGLCVRVSELNPDLLKKWIEDDSVLCDNLSGTFASYRILRYESISKIVMLYNKRLKYALQDTTDNYELQKMFMLDACNFSDSLGRADAEQRSLKISTASIFLLSSAVGPMIFLFGGSVLMLPPKPPKITRPDVVKECYDFAYSQKMDKRKRKYSIIAFVAGCAVMVTIGMMQ